MKNKILLLAKVLVSALLLYLISKKIDLGQLSDSVKKGDLVFLSAALITGIAFNCLKFLRWHKIIKTTNPLLTFMDAAKSYMVGNSIGLVTPLRAGDLGRALYFSKGERSKIMGLTLIDRIMDITAVLALSVAGSFILISKGLGVLVAVLALFCLLLLYSQKAICSALENIIPNGPLWDKIHKLINMLRGLDKSMVTKSLLISLLAFTIVLVQFYYLLAAFEPPILWGVILVTPLIALSTIIPVSFMGLGVREGISVVLFSGFGVTGATAFTIAFLGFVINNVLISIVGIYFLSRTGSTEAVEQD